MRTSRTELKSFFQAGDKPTQSQFEAWHDSYIHKRQDGLFIDDNGNLLIGHNQTEDNENDPALDIGVRLDVNGAIKIGEIASGINPPIGTIRWNATINDFQGKIGESNNDWVSMTGKNIDIPDIPNTGWQLINGTSTRNGSVLIVGGTILNGGTSVSVQGSFTTNTSDVNLNRGVTIREKLTLTRNTDLESEGSLIIRAQNGTVDIQGNESKIILNQRSYRYEIRHQRNDELQIFGIENTFGASNNEFLRIDRNGRVWKQNGGSFESLTSDRRVKKNIEPFSFGLSYLMKFNPSKYEYNGKAGTIEGKEYVGLIAQEVQEIFPEMVGKRAVKLENDSIELLTLDTSPLIYIAINSIKEINNRLEILEKNAK